MASADPAALEVGEYLADFLAAPLGRRLTVVGGGGAPSVLVEILLATSSDAAFGDEGYQLAATPRAVTPRAWTAAVLFYGVQSRMLPP